MRLFMLMWPFTPQRFRAGRPIQWSWSKTLLYASRSSAASAAASWTLEKLCWATSSMLVLEQLQEWTDGLTGVSRTCLCETSVLCDAPEHVYALAWPRSGVKRAALWSAARVGKRGGARTRPVYWSASKVPVPGQRSALCCCGWTASISWNNQSFPCVHVYMAVLTNVKY